MEIRRVWLFVLLLLAAVASLYGQFLSNPIVFDDLYLFTTDSAGNQPVSGFHFSLFELRSLPYATLAWGKDWFGLDLFHFRVENLLLHAAVVLALFYFLMRLFDAAYGVHVGRGLSPRHAAFFAALLFAVHPVATYAAGYLIQRSIVMATLFSLLTMLAYLHGSVRNKSVWLWASVPFYYLAVFSKEHAIMLPAVLLALTMLLHDDWRTRLKQRWAIFAALAGIAILVFLLRKSLVGSVYEVSAPEMLGASDGGSIYLLSVLTQSWLFFKYALLWILPNPDWMSVDMREPFAQSLLSPYLLALAGFVAWGAMAFWLLLKRGVTGLAGFAMLFPWFMFFTEFSSVRIQEIFVLYRSYLWAVGAFCLLPLILYKCSARLAAVVMAIIALAMFPVSMDRLATFSHPLLLWDDAEKLLKGRDDLPGAYRIYYNRGTELIDFGSLDQGIADLQRAVALSRDFAEAYGNMGVGYLKKREWQKAVASFDRAIEITQGAGKTSYMRYYFGRAQAYEKLGDTQKAKADYRVTCQLAGKGCDKL